MPTQSSSSHWTCLVRITFVWFTSYCTRARFTLCAPKGSGCEFPCQQGKKERSCSSSEVCKYDVFLSFRGEDTRTTFVSHLYDALHRKGIHVFKDDERLETGKSISSELLKAIEESRFAVVIFSKSYASSKWCLEELAHIIHCRNEKDQIVIPIFYDVTPSDVRHQNPPFADSFSQHEEVDFDKVKRWRDAFAEAGKISGHDLKNFKDEAVCINKLVDDIFPKLLKVVSPFPESLVGMESQIEKVISLLDMESNDVRFIGIWGMGGIGKTEMASFLYQQLRRQFEADCFLGDVGAWHQENGMAWLEQFVIGKLLSEKMTLTCKNEGLNIIKNMLRQKKVLFILDDVNQHEQLEYLVGDAEWFGKGSRIILTARDKHLLIRHVEDKVYEVQLLSENEALELFSRHAFREKSPQKDYMELSKQVVEYAGGLPLALKVLGGSFYRRDKEQWRDIIERLKKIPHSDIIGKLRISFDGLDKEERRIFLDLACLYERDSRDYVKLVLESRGIQLIGIDYLVEKSLLCNRPCWRFEMHNLIREMGEYVLREEYTNSRIWLPEEVGELFAGKLEAEKVETLRTTNYSCFKDEVFKKMQSLQVLIIDEEFDEDEFVYSTITYLPSSLRWIDWKNYPSSSLPMCFEPSHLVGLSLRNSLLVQLWPTSKRLSNLKHLVLSNSLELTKTPNFGDMPNLETLHLCNCENLEEVHRSLGYCRMLTSLDMRGCKKLKKLPKFVSMGSLESLSLKYCESLKQFPEVCGDMRRLSSLAVGSPRIRSLPQSLSGLSHLELINCDDLESIPDTITRNLKSLRILCCNKIASLPLSLGVQNKLVGLVLEGCESLKKLPSSIQMESLEDLRIGSCPKLLAFPEINGHMHSLPKLILTCTGIRELPSSIENLSSLIELSLEGCEDLVSLPNSLGNLKNLRHLFLRGCKKLEKLPEKIGDLQQLIHLDARETAISQLPLSFTKLGKLDKLQLSSFVLHQVSGLSSLRDLSLHNCSILGGFPEDFGCLSSLEYLRLVNCNILCGLPEDLGCLSSLKSLELCNSNIFGGLPGEIGPFHCLSNLDVSGTDISCLPKSINKLLRLETLNIQSCQNLNELPRELPPNLENLYVDDHLALKSITDLLTKCIKLQQISFLDNTQCKPISTNQDLLKFIDHFLRTFIQGHFHGRRYFHVSFPIGRRIPELFDHSFSINLNPSWYTDKFMGFLICCRVNGNQHGRSVTWMCMLSNPKIEHSLYYHISPYHLPHALSFVSIIYIPFKTLWHARPFDSKQGKQPDDYCQFQVYTSHVVTCWSIYLEYENKRRRLKRMQGETTQCPELLKVPSSFRFSKG